MNSVIEYIKEYAVSQPDKYAVCELRKNVTYRQYWERIGKMAEVLLTKNISKGTHVVLRCTQNIGHPPAASIRSSFPFCRWPVKRWLPLVQAVASIGKPTLSPICDTRSGRLW